jgi:predicted RNase H-like HicB family nuclease
MPHQVRQVRSLVIRYKLAEGAECAADGPTRQEVLANAGIVIQEWIDTAQELGRPILEPKGRLLFA